MNEKKLIFNKLNEGKGRLEGTTRPAPNVQLDKWVLDGKKYMVTSLSGQWSSGNRNPNYSNERLELLTEIN